MDVKIVTAQALALSAEDRARLAEELLASLGSEPESLPSRECLEEVRHRTRDIDNDLVVLVPGEEVARKARALLR